MVNNQYQRFACGEINNQLSRGCVMIVRIEDTCTACGLCVDTCPDVFEMGSDIAEVAVERVPAEFEDAVQQAADECPAEAIIIE